MSFPKGAEGAEVVGAEVVGAEVSNPLKSDVASCAPYGNSEVSFARGRSVFS